MTGPASWSILAIDLGGSQIRAARVGPDLSVASRQAIPTMAHLGVDSVLDRLTDLARAVQAADGAPPAAAAISTPGPVDAARGLVLEPPNLPGWDRVPLAEKVAAATGLPTVLERDTKVAMLAEWRHGAATGARHAIYMTVSTGIGGALVINDELVDGATGTAGEIGHLTVELDGPACRDGAHGHLEAVASGTALAREGEDLARDGESPALAAARAAGATIDAKLVCVAADSGDLPARAVVDRAWRAIGAACAGLVNVLNPEVIVLGGAIADNRPDLHLAVRDAIAESAFPAARARVRVVAAQFGADVSLVGGVPLAARNTLIPLPQRSPA